MADEEWAIPDTPEIREHMATVGAIGSVVSGDLPWQEWRQSENVDDRRNEPPQSASERVQNEFDALEGAPERESKPWLAKAERPRSSARKPLFFTPGEDDINHGSDAPERIEGSAFNAAFPRAAAGFRLHNPLGSAISAEYKPDFVDPDWDPKPAFDALKDTPYEDHIDRFIDIHNGKAWEATKRQIDRETEDKKLLGQLPWWQQFLVQGAAGMADPTIAIPGVAVIRTAAGGVALARTAATGAGYAALGAGIQETALHASQETRTLEESAITVGGSVVLGGLLGGAVGKFLTPAEFHTAAAKIDAEIAAAAVEAAPTSSGGIQASAGAAAVDVPNIRVGGTVARAIVEAPGLRKLNGISRMMSNDIPEARQIATETFEMGFHVEGGPPTQALETKARLHQAGLGEALLAEREQYKAYRLAAKEARQNEPQMTWSDFDREVAIASRREDRHTNPFVQHAAEQWRKHNTDPLKDDAIEIGALPKDVKPEYAASYAARVYDRPVMIVGEDKMPAHLVERYGPDGWHDRVVPEVHYHLKRDFIEASKAYREKIAKLDEKVAAAPDDKKLTSERAKLERDFYTKWETEGLGQNVDPMNASAADFTDYAKQVSKEAYDKIVGNHDEPPVRPEFLQISARGPLHERTFPVRDVVLEPFLVNSMEKLARHQTRYMSMDIEITRQHGDPLMTRAFERLKTGYDREKAGVTDAKKLQRLKNHYDEAYKDLTNHRDIMRGMGRDGPYEGSWGRISRALGQVNYLRSMGGIVWAGVSLNDAAIAALRTGVMKYMGGFGNLARGLEGIKLARSEVRRAGIGYEAVTGSRHAQLSDIFEPITAKTRPEAALDYLTDKASRFNGIRWWTDNNKLHMGVYVQDHILENSLNFGKLTAKEEKYLRFLGIGQSEAERIAARFKEHGETIDGIREANTHLWTVGLKDDELARARADVRLFRTALAKDVNTAVLEPGVGDIPLFFNTPTGRAIFQFNRFVLAAHQRITLRGLQEGDARGIGSIVGMVASGMATVYLKTWYNNRPQEREKLFSNPGYWVSEAIDAAGLLSVPIAISNAIERFAGVNPVKDPIKTFDPKTQTSQKIQGQNAWNTMGPTAGFVFGDATTALRGVTRYASEGKVTKAEKNAMYRVMPFNSFPFVRQIINYFANPPENKR